MQFKPNVLDGRCHCGCGELTRVARWTDRYHGWRKGEHVRFLGGHAARSSPVEYIVDADTGCWVWQRWIKNGYGVVILPSRSTRGAHRIYFEREHGPVAAGLHLDHLCRNKACVNPAHLQAVTCADNVRRGLRAKLTQNDVDAIRRRVAAGEMQVTVATDYGIDASWVSRIVNRKVWKQRSREIKAHR